MTPSFGQPTYEKVDVNQSNIMLVIKLGRLGGDAASFFYQLTKILPTFTIIFNYGRFFNAYKTDTSIY